MAANSRRDRQRLTQRCRHEWRPGVTRLAAQRRFRWPGGRRRHLAWRQNDGWTGRRRRTCCRLSLATISPPLRASFHRGSGSSSLPSRLRCSPHAVPAGRASDSHQRGICRFPRGGEDHWLRDDIAHTAERRKSQVLCQRHEPHGSLGIVESRCPRHGPPRRLSLIETARLYALLNVSIHDGLQSSHSGKFIYGHVAPR